MRPPTTSGQFDIAYQAPFTLWGDVRIPKEIRNLGRDIGAGSVLELGCGIGRFARCMARQGLSVTAVDFSGVAIDKARRRVSKDKQKPTFLVGDVTNLDFLRDRFDASYDVGCFHCLDHTGQRDFASEIARLLHPGAVHMMWAMDAGPANIPLSPDAIGKVFAPYFEITRAETSLRRFARSHWYWLTRRSV